MKGWTAKSTSLRECRCLIFSDNSLCVCGWMWHQTCLSVDGGIGGRRLTYAMSRCRRGWSVYALTERSTTAVAAAAATSEGGADATLVWPKYTRTRVVALGSCRAREASPAVGFPRVWQLGEPASVYPFSVVYFPPDTGASSIMNRHVAVLIAVSLVFGKVRKYRPRWHLITL